MRDTGNVKDVNINHSIGATLIILCNNKVAATVLASAVLDDELRIEIFRVLGSHIDSDLIRGLEELGLAFSEKTLEENFVLFGDSESTVALGSLFSLTSFAIEIVLGLSVFITESNKGFGHRIGTLPARKSTSIGQFRLFDLKCALDSVSNSVIFFTFKVKFFSVLFPDDGSVLILDFNTQRDHFFSSRSILSSQKGSETDTLLSLGKDFFALVFDNFIGSSGFITSITFIHISNLWSVD